MDINLVFGPKREQPYGKRLKGMLPLWVEHPERVRSRRAPAGPGGERGDDRAVAGTDEDVRSEEEAVAGTTGNLGRTSACESRLITTWSLSGVLAVTL